jgi:hypothetical protein
MSAAAVIILRRKKFIRRFAEQGATSPDRAISHPGEDQRGGWPTGREVRSFPASCCRHTCLTPASS